MAMGGGGGQSLFDEAGPGTFDDADPDYERDAASKAARLMGFVQRFVRPKEPWESEGGRSKIDIMVDRGLMVVYTTPDGHTMIETLLERVVPAEKRNMVIDVRVVELDPAALGVEEPAGFVARTDAQKAALKKATTTVHARTSVSGTDGQVLSSEKGTATTYVADQEPVVAEAAVAWNPVISYLVYGAVLDVKATMQPWNERIWVTVRHPSVLDSLRRLTGQDFGYDLRAWRTWYFRHYLPSKAAGDEQPSE